MIHKPFIMKKLVWVYFIFEILVGYGVFLLKFREPSRLGVFNLILFFSKNHIALGFCESLNAHIRSG